ncbi:MAG: glycosyltransferase family 39 protein [Elusimicrobiota bacterium]|nr:MAG: glycosyltransferase family 39 protein [Elusimicrobiota bacterium]
MKAFVAVVAAAFALRLALSALTLPLLDELNWMRVVDRARIGATAPSLPAHGDQHPPGQAWWGAIGVAAAGRNLVGYRLGSVVLGTVAVAATGLLAWELFGAAAGVLAAALLAVNEYHLDASHRCTEKSYLAFAALALLLLVRLARAPSIRRWVAVGEAFGLGALTKQTLLLWTAPAALFIGLRLGWKALRGRGALLATATFLVLISIDLVWNLGGTASPADPAARGLAYQLGRLSLGSWSWGPAALFLRPLNYWRVEGAISEYASMTTIPGLILLGSVLAGAFVLKGPETRFLQGLGAGTLLFFCVGSDPRGEFWWADLVLIPFVALAAGAWARLTPRAPALPAALLLACALPAARLFADQDNYHPLDWGEPSPFAVEKFTSSQRLLFLGFRERDFASLTSWPGGAAMPARARHARALRSYRDGPLASLPAAERERERRWVDRQIVKAETGAGL